jgi:TatD DNase family protein
MIFDTHVHLGDETLYERLEDVLDAARANGVEKMITLGIDRESGERAMKIAREHDGVYAAIGFHPSEAHKITEEDFVWLKEHLNDPEVVAIGEVGLDFHWDDTHEKEQKDVFKRQIELANRYRMPLLVHMRDAVKSTMDALSSFKDPETTGIMHCYSGSVQSMRRFVDLDMFIALGGPVTFTNAKTPKEVAKAVPGGRLLVETDAPFLAPHPHRGKTNEPRLIVHTVETIAHLRDIDRETLETITYDNAMKLFGLGDVTR